MTARSPSILVVDDDADNRNNLADIFADLGYHADTAPDGPTALTLARRGRYDVAILDLMMPGMDGASLYAELKQVQAGTVALIVTAYPENPRAAAALAAGAWMVFPKPVEFPRLLALVDEALARPLVLVVDDDADLCANLWDLLREHGYRVCLASDGATAAERLQSGAAFQVILLDLKLPDADGTQVFRQARQAHPQAQVVFITGHVMELEQRIQQALAEGAHAVLPKPFDIPDLLAVVKRLTTSTTTGPGQRGTQE